MTEHKCPCGTCVSCDCDPNPQTDEDGLCVSCGGVPLYVAKLCADGDGAVPPHVGPEMTGNQRDRILEFIEDEPGPIDRKELLADIVADARELTLAELVWVSSRVRSMRDEVTSDEAVSG